MTTQHWLDLYLVLHITGFTLMAGLIIADFSLDMRLNKYLLADKPRAITILEGAAGFPRLIGLGAFLLLATGIGMVVLLKGVVAKMLWFKIKMFFIVLVVLNGSLILRRQESKLKHLLLENSNGSGNRILALKRNMSIFHLIEITLFLVIFLLSVFQF
jgi:hypothetical protein